MRHVLWISSAMLLVAPLAAFAGPQQSDKTPPPSNPPATVPAVVKPPQPQSLAEAARKAREKKAAETKTKVWDNDNIPGTTAPPPAAAGEAAPAADDSAASAGDEKAWRERFATARAKLKRDQDSLALQQKDFGRLSIQYYPDPQKAMTEQYTRKDINEKDAKIAAKQKEIEQLKQGLSDLEDAWRKAGGDPGWAR